MKTIEEWRDEVLHLRQELTVVRQELKAEKVKTRKARDEQKKFTDDMAKWLVEKGVTEGSLAVRAAGDAQVHGHEIFIAIVL